jgi:hypothetical protein
MAVFVYNKTVQTGVPEESFDQVPFQPKALLVFITNRVSTGPADSSAASLSMGMSDGTTDHCSSMGSDTGEYTFEQEASLVNLIDKDGATLAKGTIKEFHTTGWTISWSVQPSSAYHIHYVAFGGDAITNAKIIRGNAVTTSFSLTGAGFTPDYAIGMHGHSNTYPTSISDTANASFGLWMDGGASSDRNGGGTDRINDAANMSSMAVRGGNPVTRWRDDTRFRVSSFDADGVTFAGTLTGAMDVQVLCLKSDGVNFQSHGETIAVNVAGDTSETRPGFEPELLWILSSGQNTGDDFDQGYGGWCIGFADHFRQFSIFIGQDDDTPHATGIKVTTNRMVTENGADHHIPSVEDLNVEHKSMDANGFTLTVNNEAGTRVVHHVTLTWGDGASSFFRGIVFADGIIL